MGLTDHCWCHTLAVHALIPQVLTKPLVQKLTQILSQHHMFVFLSQPAFPLMQEQFSTWAAERVTWRDFKVLMQRLLPRSVKSDPGSNVV